MTSLSNSDAHAENGGQRLQLLRSLDACISASESGRSTAVFIAEVSNIHEVNAQHGYAVGDQVLDHLFEKLKTSIKKANIIVRVSAKSYALVVSGMKSEKMLPVAAQRIVDLLTEPYALDDDLIHINCNIGISSTSATDEKSDELLLRAESSLSVAKQKCLAFHFNAANDASLLVPPLNRRMLDLALAEDEFHFLYQPKVNLITGAPEMCEALIRWNHKGYGNIPTEEFIAAAEKSGLVHMLTTWASKAIIRETSNLSYLGSPMGVAMNVSAKDLYHVGLLEALDGALAIWDMSPSLFTLEVTEGAFMENPKYCFEVLSRVRQRGIRVSIDDFGTGYSSLAYFKHIPADEIKIDKSFILDLENSQENQWIVEAIISLAHKFKMKVVAEGIESAESLQILKNLGCDYAQGYHLSKPQQMQSLKRWLQKFDFQEY